MIYDYVGCAQLLLVIFVFDLHIIQIYGETVYLENHIHINPIGVGPGMLEIFLQALFQRIWDLEKISMLCYIP